MSSDSLEIGSDETTVPYYLHPETQAAYEAAARRFLAGKIGEKLALRGVDGCRLLAESPLLLPVHEAAHAVVAVRHERKRVRSVSIIPNNDSSGRCILGARVPGVDPEPPEGGTSDKAMVMEICNWLPERPRWKLIRRLYGETEGILLDNWGLVFDIAVELYCEGELRGEALDKLLGQSPNEIFSTRNAI